jgi:hypothetical protein
MSGLKNANEIPGTDPGDDPLNENHELLFVLVRGSFYPFPKMSAAARQEALVRQSPAWAKSN